jgi:two-component system nitrate/nitrite response regulator NarL
VTTVTIVASLPSVRLGLADMLASHGHTVVAEDDTSDAGVWVLDAPAPPALDALTAQRYSDSPRAAVVLSDDAGMANQLARAGLRGWAVLGRDADADQLDLAVRSAEAGLVLLDLPLAVTSLSLPQLAAGGPAQAIDPLTARELQVLQLVAQGLPNKGIARRLGISENTAKFHVASLCGKLGASSRTEAVTLAARRGLILLERSERVFLCSRKFSNFLPRGQPLDPAGGRGRLKRATTSGGAAAKSSSSRNVFTLRDVCRAEAGHVRTDLSGGPARSRASFYPPWGESRNFRLLKKTRSKCYAGVGTIGAGSSDGMVPSATGRPMG